MPRGHRRQQPELLAEFLENDTVPILRKLAGLLNPDPPTRKSELVALIQQRLEDPRSLRQLWAALDPVQQAAVAEVVHSPAPRFDAAGFRARYGQDPDWGQLTAYGRADRPSRLRLFIHNGTMPRDLRARLQAFVPPPRVIRDHTVEEPPATGP